MPGQPHPVPGQRRRLTELRLQFDDSWRAATVHRFLLEARDGSLSPQAFDAWLAQDHRFVAGLAPFQRRLVERVPDAQVVLESGLAALEEELAWFRDQARRRGIDLDAGASPVTEEYLGWLARLDSGPPALALTALWALEQVYLDAWRAAAPGSPPYDEFVAHWTTPQFAAYVESLADAADRALQAGHPEPDPTDVVVEVCRLETRFWDAALAEPS